MFLALIIILLLIWAGVVIKEKVTPSAPPIDDLDEHIKQLSSLPDKKARQNYLKNRKLGDK